MKALVLGASGFLGAHITRALVDAGFAVTAVVREAARAPAEASAALVVDLHAAVPPPESLAGHDVAVHAAALAPSWGDYREWRRAAAAAHRRLVLALVQARVPRLVLVSSAMVYGTRLAGVVTEERRTRSCGDLCSDVHADAERIAHEAHAYGLLDVVVLRPGTCYGAGDRRFLPRLEADLAAGRSALIGDGSAPAQLCHAEHVGALAARAATHPAAPGKAFHVLDRALLSWREVLACVAAARGVPAPARRVPEAAARLVARVLAALPLAAEPPLTPHVVELLTARHALSLEAAACTLGWVPRWDTAAGLRATLGA